MVKAGRKRLWLIGRKRLFFSFAFGLNGRLESEAGSLLSGDVLDWSVFWSLRLRCGSAFEGEDDLADFDLLALL